MTFLLFLPFIFVLYFLLFRPQQQRVRRQQELVRAIDVGDQVVTAGGLIGRVVAVTDDRMRLEVADGVVIEFLRLAVSRRLEESEQEFEEEPPSDDDFEENYGETDGEAEVAEAEIAEAEVAEAEVAEAEVAEAPHDDTAVAAVTPAAVTAAAVPTISESGNLGATGTSGNIEEATAPAPGQDPH